MVLKWCPSPQKRPIKSNIKIREISTVREVTKRDSQHCGAAASAEVRAMHGQRGATKPPEVSERNKERQKGEVFVKKN